MILSVLSILYVSTLFTALLLFSSYMSMSEAGFSVLALEIRGRLLKGGANAALHKQCTGQYCVCARALVIELKCKSSS